MDLISVPPAWMLISLLTLSLGSRSLRSFAAGSTFLLSLLLGGFSGGAGAASAPVAPDTIQTMAGIRALLPDEARRAASVRISGTVTFVRSDGVGFYLEGSDAGVFCDFPQPSPRLHPGDVVEVEGLTAAGPSPYVRAHSVRAVAKAALPLAKPLALRELDPAQHAARRILVRGLIKEVKLNEIQNMLLLTQDGKDLEVLVQTMAVGAVETLQFAEIECQGTLAVSPSLDGRPVVPRLLVNASEDVRVLSSAESIVTPIARTALAEIVAPGLLPLGQLVRTTGVVNYAVDDFLWLGDGSLGLRVRCNRRGAATLGESVEVLGFVQTDGPVVELVHSRVVSAAQVGRLPPRLITKDELLDWRNFGAFVSITGDAAGSARTSQGDLLLLTANRLQFQARLKFPSADAPLIETGSRVTVTGVLFLEVPTGETTPVCRILVATPPDISIVAPPPWPLAKTVAVVTGLSVALGLGLLGMVGGYLWLRRAHRRALAELVSQGALLSEAQRIGQVGSWEWDVATGVQAWSAESYRIFGHEPGSIQPSQDRFVAAVHADDRDRVLTAGRSALDSGSPYDLECRILRPNGELRHLHFRGEVVRSSTGAALKMRGTVTDITDRKRVELRDHLRARALEMLATGSELASVLDRIVKVLEGDHESWMCCVMLADEKCQRLSCIASGQLSPVFRDSLDGLELKPGASICAQAVLRREPVIVRDVEAHVDTTEFTPLFQKVGLRACWSHPILSSIGVVLGTFSVYHRSPRSPSPSELEDLAHTANLASIVIEHWRNEAARRDSEKRLQEAQAIAHVGSFYWNATTNHLIWSKELYRIFGRSPSEFEPTFDSYAASIHEQDRQAVLTAIRSAMASHQVFSHDYRAVLPEGGVRWLQARGLPVVDGSGQVIGLQGTCQDITERRQLEAQVRHIQKMEAIGTLAGGIAHDFNNLLSSILGNSYLARLELDDKHAAIEHLSAIEVAGNRAKSLVKQILSFSRQQEPRRQVLDLSSIITEVVSMLRATLPAGVELIPLVSGDAPPVLADATQMHQVLLNLCTNAWHALENDRGRIEIRLQNLDIPSRATQSEGQLKAGRYACLSVTDTGHGMDAATMERIFDPFFTSKEPGKGTGLGLAVVHGIVESHEGVIRVSSQPRHGTTFQILLPAAAALPDRSDPVLPGVVQGHGERILFVDDEASLAEIAIRMLNRLGYRAETHTRHTDALEALRENPEGFDLVITDQNMPGLSGLEFAEAVRKVRPGIPIVLSSGHITDELMKRAEGAGIRRVLHKPASIEELSNCMAQLLTKQRA